MWSALAAHGEQVASERASRAAAGAEALVPALVQAVATQPDMTVEDELCARMGAQLREWAQEAADKRVGPGPLAEATIRAAASAVAAALPSPAERAAQTAPVSQTAPAEHAPAEQAGQTAPGEQAASAEHAPAKEAGQAAPVGQADQAPAWWAPWRVLTAVAGIVPHPHRETAADTIARLRKAPGGRVLPADPPGPAVTGPVLWTRDAYGSRFAVTAPITTGSQPVRWYLWDVDACGFMACTVHSGFYPTCEDALATWQAGVGQTAAGGTVLTPADDPWLLAGLMYAEEGTPRADEASDNQFAESHRSMRLGQEIKATLPQPRPRSDAGLKGTDAAVEFATWLRTSQAGQQELPADLDELATELAESWCINNIDAVYAACSPHRVALNVLHIRDYYLDDFADELVALLPAWTTWLSQRNATPPQLAERCQPYAHGKPHPQLGDDEHSPHYLARVIE